MMLKINKKFNYPKNGNKINTLNKLLLKYTQPKISSRNFSEHWVNLDNKFEYFKTYSFAKYYKTKEFRYANEVLCYILAKQMGVDCIKYNFAHFDCINNDLKHNFLKNNQKLIYADSILVENNTKLSNNFFNYQKCLNNLKLQNYDIDVDKIMRYIYKICIFDLLTFQTDRHKTNIAFVIEEKNNTKKLKPFFVFDNKFAFGTITLHKFLVDELEDDYDDNMQLPSMEFIAKFNYTATYITFVENNFDYETNVKYAILLAQQNNDYKKILNYMLKNFDMHKAIESIKQEGYKFAIDQEELYLTIAELSKQTFIDEIKKLKKSTTNKATQEDIFTK